jgi:hypothetical protein
MMKSTRNVAIVSNVTTSKIAAAIANITRFLLMAMCVVRIRHMWMRMPQRLVAMPVAVHPGRHREVRMIVVPVVVAVRVFVLCEIVPVLMAVRFR